MVFHVLPRSETSLAILPLDKITMAEESTCNSEDPLSGTLRKLHSENQALLQNLYNYIIIIRLGNIGGQ